MTCDELFQFWGTCQGSWHTIVKHFQKKTLRGSDHLLQLLVCIQSLTTQQIAHNFLLVTSAATET